MATSVKVVGADGGGGGAKKVIVITGASSAELIPLLWFKRSNWSTGTTTQNSSQARKPEHAVEFVGQRAVKQQQQRYLVVGNVLTKRGGLACAEMG